VPDFLQDVKILATTRCLGQFLLHRLLRMHKNGHFQLPVKFLTEHLKFSWTDLCMFGAKNSFRNATFPKIWGLWGVEIPIFWSRPLEDISSADFRAFWATDRPDPSAGFSATREYEKREGITSHRKSYISPIWGEIPTRQNLTKLGMWVGVPDTINRAKFGNNRLSGFNVMKGRIFHFSIGMDCRL